MTGSGKTAMHGDERKPFMRPLLLVAAIPFLASAAPPSKGPGRVSPITGEVCMTPPLRSAHTTDGMLRRSDESVTYDLHHAVVRSVDGCIVPAIVRRDVDGRATKGTRPNPKRTFVRPL